MKFTLPLIVLVAFVAMVAAEDKTAEEGAVVAADQETEAQRYGYYGGYRRYGNAGYPGYGYGYGYGYPGYGYNYRGRRSTDDQQTEEQRYGYYGGYGYRPYGYNSYGYGPYGYNSYGYGGYRPYGGFGYYG